MVREKVHLKSGFIVTATYSREDLDSPFRIKNLVQNLYDNKLFLDTKIVWLERVVSIDDYTVKDVLEEYIKTKKLDTDKVLVFTQAGILNTDILPPSGLTDEAIEIIKNEGSILSSLGFYNTIFTRHMSLVYGNPDYYLLKSDKSDKFIEDDAQLLDNRMIDRIA